MRRTLLRRRNLPPSRQAGLAQACREEERSMRIRFREGWRAMAGAMVAAAVMVVGWRVMVGAAAMARVGAAWKGPA